jgi:hypothetical protein
MATPYFEEVQRLRDNPWIILLVFVVAIGSLLPLLYGIYWQIGQGIPWGNEPMTNSSLIAITLMVLGSMAVMAFIMLNLRLEIKIDEQGVHYRMFPVKSKWRLVRPSEIVDYTLAERFKIFESGGIGHHRNILKNSRSFRISGGKHIAIKFNDGHRLLLGTQNLTGMEWAMRKLMKKM